MYWGAYHCELCLCSIKTSPQTQSLKSEGRVPTVWKQQITHITRLSVQCLYPVDLWDHIPICLYKNVVPKTTTGLKNSLFTWLPITARSLLTDYKTQWSILTANIRSGQWKLPYTDNFWLHNCAARRGVWLWVMNLTDIWQCKCEIVIMIIRMYFRFIQVYRYIKENRIQ